VAPQNQKRVSTKVLYKPVGRVCGLLAGLLAGALFKRVWRRVTHGDHDRAPSALQLDYSMGEIVVAAMLQGAIHGAVSVLIDRAGARAFQRWTGEWPGDCSLAGRRSSKLSVSAASFVGREKVFEAVGFRRVAAPDPKRALVRLELDGQHSTQS